MINTFEAHWNSGNCLSFLSKAQPYSKDRRVHLKFVEESIKVGQYDRNITEEKFFESISYLNEEEALSIINKLMESSGENVHVVGRIAAMQAPPSMREIKEFMHRMDSHWSDEGFANFMEKEMHRVKDEDAIHRYLKLCQDQQKNDEVERVLDLSDHYAPEKVLALLKRASPPNPKAHYRLCRKHNIEMEAELKRYEINDTFDFKRLCLHDVMKKANLQAHKIDTFQKVGLDFLDDLSKVLLEATGKITSGELSKNETFVYQELSRDYQLEGLHDATWPQNVLTEQGEFYQTLNVLDCIIISNKLKELKYDPQANPIVHLAGHQVDVNSKQVLVKGNPGQRYVLQRSYTGKRVRLRNSRRGESTQFDLTKAIEENWKTQAGEYGLKWSVKLKQQKWATPSPNEILDGLRKWWIQ